MHPYRLLIDGAISFAHPAPDAERTIDHGVAKEERFPVHDRVFIHQFDCLLGCRAELLADETVGVKREHDAEALVYGGEADLRLLLLLEGLQGDRVVWAHPLADLAMVVAPELVELDVGGEEAAEARLELYNRPDPRGFYDLVRAAPYALETAEASPHE